MTQNDLSICNGVDTENDYYSGARMERIRHSINQAENGEIITKSIAELEAMEKS